MLSSFFNGFPTVYFKGNDIISSITNFANNFNKELKYFHIKTIYQGNPSLPSIIFINGFLQKDESVKDWLRAVSQKFTNNTKIWVNWDSKKLEELYTLIPNIGQAMQRFLVDFWYTAELNAEKAGIRLANELMKRDNKSGYIIMGHSLGCRVAYNAVKRINHNVKINSMYLLSGAIGNQGWEPITKKVKNKIYNFYSPEDPILFYAYKLASAGLAETPIGIAPISLYSSKIKNQNVTKILNKYNHSSSFIHMRYKDAFREILQKMN